MKTAWMSANLEPHYATLGSNPLRDAFAARRAVLPWRSQRPLGAEAVPALWAQLLAGHRPQRHRLVYLHVPFCANHCLFCGFYRYAHTPDGAAAYADLLAREIEHEASLPFAQRAPIDAVYLGGGTPSALSSRDLERVLAAVRRHLPLTDDCEITLEGRSVHFDADKIDACLTAGVNRISIGVQSFDTDVRRRQGRRTDKAGIIRFLQDLRRREGLTLVVDLLYGLPGQTPEVWHEDLRIAATLDLDGIDLYGLNLIPGTPLHRAIGAGKFPAAAALQDLGALYRTGAEFLGAAGWTQISNSHWRRTPRERNRYNLRIKEGTDCLAYGAGAGGLAGAFSYIISPDLQAYEDAVRRQEKPLAGILVADALQPARQLVTAGFEVGRLDLGGVEAATPPSTHGAFRQLAAQWQSAGLARLDGDVVALTTAGCFWYSNLIFAFDAVLSDTAPAASAEPSRPSLKPASNEAMP